MNDLTEEQKTRFAENLLAILREQMRLKQLTNAQLVAEALPLQVADDLVALEMMNRLDPGWEDRCDDQAGEVVC